MNEQLVLGAVKQTEASKKQGVLQKLFAAWFDAFVYNQIWEDPRVDLQALKLGAGSRILTISSGGCNALNYLLEAPQAVTAVDLNRHHIFLLDLKLAALENLPGFDDFFAFFGFGKGENTRAIYQQRIAPKLGAAARRFWDKKIRIFTRGGLYEHSRNGYFLRFFHRFAHLLGCRPEEVLKAQTIEEQSALYEQQIAPFYDSFLIKMIGKLPVTLFGLGIPPQQYDELKKDLGQGGSIIDIYRERTRRLAAGYPIGDNYFAWQAFARKYDTEKCRAVPEYLKAENYEKLRANAGRLRTKTGSITEEIKIQPEGTFNRFVFLDAQDWMNAAAMTELWQAVADKGAPGSRIIFRTAGSASPIETNLPTALRDRFVYEAELSKQLFAEDRASIYGGFHLYILKS